MRFSFRKFCCFFELHQGFIFAVYFQIPKFIWTIFISVSNVLTSPSFKISTIFYTFNILAVMNESFFSMRSYLMGIRINDFQIHRNFFCAKLLFILSNFMSFEAAKTTFFLGFEEKFNIIFFFNFFLYIYDIYLLIIIYFFAMRVKRGYYGQIGVEPIFRYNSFSSNFVNSLTAIVLETIGLKLNKCNIKEIEIGVIMKKTRANKRKNHKKNLKIYP